MFEGHQGFLCNRKPGQIYSCGIVDSEFQLFIYSSLFGATVGGGRILVPILSLCRTRHVVESMPGSRKARLHPGLSEPYPTDDTRH